MPFRIAALVVAGAAAGAALSGGFVARAQPGPASVRHYDPLPR